MEKEEAALFFQLVSGRYERESMILTVEFINPSATYANRAQDMLVGLKTDDLDLGAIGDLLIRGKS